MDLDGTICPIKEPHQRYENLEPYADVVDKMREYKAMGFRIVISSARNMRTYSGDIGKINVHTLPVIIEWLRRHCIPFDEIIVGKPWCGTGGFYVDDKAIRPDEFVDWSYAEITKKITGSSSQPLQRSG
ncbi:MAG: capsular biosynthesis protein [Deltaproteobacteria bacterium]|nr:capsular biosynthesis protein [Deltaproteobacteria bacterium]